jgi:Ca-activated chloride channel family protein
LYQKQKYDQASKKFYKAHQEKPHDPKISYNLGNSLYKKGSFKEALQSYSKSTEQKSSLSVNQRAKYNMGNALYRMNKLEKSIEAYKKALELDRSDMDSKFNLEFVREKIKKKKQEQNKSEEKKENSKPDSKKNKNASNENVKEKTPSFKESSKLKNNPNQNDPPKKPSEKTETASKKMTKEEAELRLSVLTEDLKSFQRKQALEMKSLFTYQGNDW